MKNVDLGQVVSALEKIYQEPLKDGEKRKIIFWMDPEESFTEDINQIEINNVKIHVMSESNQFYTKYLLEEKDPNSHYLIYTNLELDTEDNWLADTVFYSQTFYADKLSIIMNEIQIDPSFRGVLKKYEKFFENKNRYRKFKAFGIKDYTDELIEIAMMSVLCNVKTPDFEEVVKVILMDSLDDNNNRFLTDIEKFFDIDVFWQHVAIKYGYVRETKSLKTLLIHLLITTLSHTVDEKVLINLQGYIAEYNRPNALVFVDHWMHHKTDYEIFDKYAEQIEQEIQIMSVIQQQPIEKFIEAEIFPAIDRAIIIYIVNSILEQKEDYDEYINYINIRRTKHFYEKYQNLYEALYYTVLMFKFYKEYQNGIPQGKAHDIYQAYVDRYHYMDTYYRKFYVAYDEESNNEILKKLQEVVENLYTNWYLAQLNAHWSKAIKQEMENDWSLPGILKQQHFYASIVRPHIDKNERVFVIISDAMRYEIGVELAERLGSETMGISKIDTMLSVVPSVTKLGMAALLPHREIDFDEKGRVLVNGNDSSGLDNRKKIIESIVDESIAIDFDEMIAMNKAGRRERFKGKKLIYIYHDTIDAMGDKASTEMYTFTAVEKAIDQLFDLVKIIRDDLSGTNIYITADHGFLYQRDALESSDMLPKEVSNVIESKRRYILSKEKQEVSGQLAIDLSSVMKNEHQLTAYIPNSTMRYRIQGSGIQFVHGGASLQEVVVPLISYKNKRSGQKGAQAVEKVDIKLTNTTRRITNSIFSLEFFQTEKVANKLIPRTVVVYMADEEGEILSNEETIIGDRSSDNPAERTFKLRFVLKSSNYDRNKTYYLIMKDTDTDLIIEKVPFTINLGIISDFDF